MNLITEVSDCGQIERRSFADSILVLIVGQQVNEVQMMQQHIMELESRHTSMAQQ